MSARAVPTGIRQRSHDELEISWADGHVSRFPVAALRRACPCALCVDELTGERILRPEQVAGDVRPVALEPVGRYAIRFDWSDGHSSGIYTFEHLREMCPCAGCQAGYR